MSRQTDPHKRFVAYVERLGLKAKKLYGVDTHALARKHLHSVMPLEFNSIETLQRLAYDIVFQMSQLPEAERRLS